MNLTLHLPHSVIAQHVESRYSGILYDGEVKDWTGSKSHVIVRRRGPLHLHAKGPTLCCDIALNVVLDVRREDPVLVNLIKDLGGMRQLQFSLLVTLEVGVFWETGWSLRVSVSPTMVWQQRPSIGTFLKLEVSGWLEPTIHRQLADTAVEVERNIQQELQLAHRIEEAWAQLQHAWLIDAGGPFWLRIYLSTESLRRTQVVQRDGAVILALMGPVSVLLKAGEAPTQEPEKALPLAMDLDHPPAMSETSEVPWEAVLPFAWLSHQVTNFPVEGGKVEELELVAQGSSLVAKARVRIGGRWGRISWRLEIRIHVKPVAPPEYLRIEVDQLEGLPLPLLFFRKKWQQIVENKLNEACERLVRDYHTWLVSSLEALPLEGNWLLKTSSLALELRHVELSSEDLVLRGIIQGEWSLWLTQL